MGIFRFTIVACVLIFVSAEYGIIYDEKCNTCLSEMKEIIHAMKEVVPDGGFVATCAILCEEVTKKLNNTALTVACDLVCSALGIDEINKYIHKIQLNYAKFCELANFCPKSAGSGKFLSVVVSNDPVVLGQDIDFIILLQADKVIGVADFVLECPENNTKAIQELVAPVNQGAWRFEWQVSTNNSDDGWKEGLFFCEIKVCGTICDSYPEPVEFGAKQFNFFISPKKEEILF